MDVSTKGVTFFEWREAPRNARFAVIGDPIVHSRSPVMMNAAFSAMGIDETYVAIHVQPKELEQCLDHLKSLGFLGINVTLPHKQAVQAWLESSDELSTRLRSVNTIDLESKHGKNTDMPGFMATLSEFGIAPESNVLVLGAGGSARAILAGLEAQACAVFAWNRSSDRLSELIKELNLKITQVTRPDLSEVDAVINCTSAGHDGHDLRLDWHSASPDLLAYDISYGPASEAFLATPRSLGLATVNGLAMLVEQGALALEYWLGVPAPRSAMIQALT